MGEQHRCDYCRQAFFPSFEALEDHVETAHMPPYRKDDE